MTDKVSIIVVTYNALEYVKLTLQSIRDKTSDPHEVIVVDNASEQDTREYLKSLDWIRLILNDTNSLYAAANNQGILASDEQSGYILFLNSDVEVLRGDWLSKMIEVIESKPNVGIVGPQHNFRPTGPVFGAIDGFCWMIRRELVDEVGLLDAERFPWNGSPNDFAVRAFCKGWIYKHLDPRLEIVCHFGSRSRSDTTDGKPNDPFDYDELLRRHGLVPQPKNDLVERALRKLYAKTRLGWRFYHP
jgi:GT2 family glycosyltransferase